MLLASGANFGFRRTVPHMLGISIGFSIMVLLVGLGLMGVFEAFPVAYSVLKIVSIAYLVYLAWKIANSAPPDSSDENTGVPFTFIQAALFQWVNPKAWAMALTAISVYAVDSSLGAIALVALVFGLVNLPVITIWVSIGKALRLFLQDQAKLRVFNYAMAALLIASVIPVVFGWV
ncbi:Transporter, LysE family [hydrothermal vent metagenome]|uniref:Transporter, LysE family n=1 Tax=hydrothermal vent metagenome TaxID=652676 RepID=A0A3B0RKR5_9ZZZZ